MEARDQNNITVLPTAKAQMPAKIDLESMLSALQSDPQLMQGLAAYITGEPQQETVDTSHCSNSFELVEYYFKIHDITATMEGFEQNGKRILDTTVKNQLEQWCQKNNVGNSLWSERMLKNSFKEVDRIAYDNTVIAVYESLQGEHNEDVFDCFANDLKLNYLERLVLRWWMADVKLRLAKLYNQTQFSDNQQVPIPVFYGGTGNGKSRLTRAITKVLGALAVQKNIGEVTDKFGHQQWGRLLVADFDEMAGMQRADMEQFKQWCTQDKIQRRGIFGDGQITTYKITTGIGSSNQPVDEILYDTTTSRRLYQIDAQVDGSWHDVIERTDFLGLWQSIDCDYKPSTEELNQIAKEQHNNQRRKSQIENWFEECLENIKVIQSNCNGWIGAAKLYDIYKNWCLDSNEKPVTNTKFGKEIKKFNWFEFKISGGKKYQLK